MKTRKNQKVPKAIIITGHRKSGTTLLNKLFDKHPEINVYPTDVTLLYAFFPKFTKTFKKNTDKYNRRLKNIVYTSLKNSGVSFGAKGNSLIYAKDTYNSLKKISKKYRDNPQKILSRLIIGFQRALRKNKEIVKKRVLVKETSLTAVIPSLVTNSKDYKFIVLIRDPRDNVAAILSGVKKYYSKYGESENTALASSINRIKFDLSLADYYRQKKDKRMIFIKFEDLVKKPSKILKSICKFAKIKYYKTCLFPTVHGQNAAGNNFEGKKFDGIYKGNVGKFKTRLPNKYIDIIEWFLKEEMISWGYLPKTWSISRKHLRSIDTFYQWYNPHYFFKDSFK